ncbi:flagellar hook-length control protein FliK [Polaromonas sp.]|uniref:flagellar hook-length control protein FliK n=1 Tax=Polaromonas sp. TaxID=1869339 RepID=UPI002FCB57F8
MSLTLPATSAPRQPSSSPSNATARSDEQGQDKPGSFGEALSRSLAPAEKATEKTAGKPTGPTPARRPAGDHKTDPADLANAMALPFVPLESRVAQAAPVGEAATAPDHAASATATSTAPLTDLLVGTPVPTDGAMAATEVNTDAGVQAALAPALVAASQKDAGPATLQARLNPVSDSSALQLDLGKIAGQPTAPDAGFPDQSSQGGDGAANRADKMSDAGADLTPDAHSAAKVVAPAVTPSVETPAITLTGSQTAPTDTFSASAALPINPVNAAVQGSAGISTPNALPPVTTTPLLAPEVGSSEWGKALGQQMIQMGHAGHQVAELQLNPPGLGPLKVTLSMNDHQIQAMFVSAHSSVRAAVEAALPQLRTTLADNGISLGNTSVSADSQQQTAFANSQSGQPDPRSYRSPRMMDTTALAARPVTELPRRGHGITVDTYA